MKYIFNIFVVGLLLSLVACTSARWTVKDKGATDTSNFEILEQKQFLKPAGQVTPENPVLNLELLSRTKYQYPQRVLMQRNIQKYQLRPGFMAFGLAGAAVAFYAANSKTFRGSATSTKSITLNATGMLLALSGFLNMKAVGDPRPTGEERYLRSTGNVTKIDTVDVEDPVSAKASITVMYGKKVIFEENGRPFSSGKLEIPLAGKLSELQLQGPDPGSVSISVNFKDSAYAYQYPIQSILQPYARVTKQLTELRNSPQDSEDNVLAELVKGSQVRIQSTENKQWYRVLYGISENYILKEDAQLVWQPSDFADKNEVVTVPQVPFGNIDVESNIPILQGPLANAYALILTNQNYNGENPERNYAHRDGRLIRQYLINALGYSKQSIFELHDLDNTGKLYDTISKIKSAANDSTQLFVYLSSYGTVEKGSRTLLKLIGVAPKGNGAKTQIRLDQIIKELTSISSSKTLILGDIDFSRSVSGNNLSTNEQQKLIESQLTFLSTDDQRVSFLMGQQLDQPASLYFSKEGEDKKHHIFPYFFAKALQQRKTSISDIYQYLERNVSYTSRKLHDRPQDPLLFGSTSMDLVGQ
ncbi:MAG: caspase family protein [Balneolaceae bacterium]